MKENQEYKIVNRIPMWLAVAITVLISLPFGYFLGKFNFTLWICFIVWTEYFILGSRPATARLIFPSIPFGGAIAALWYICTLWLNNILFGEYGMAFPTIMITGLVWMSLLIIIQNRWHIWVEGTLATFNGLSLTLGTYGTACYPDIGPMDNPYWPVILSWIWCVLMCYFGWVLGWLNVTITFPKKIELPAADEK